MGFQNRIPWKVGCRIDVINAELGVVKKIGIESGVEVGRVGREGDGCDRP